MYTSTTPGAWPSTISTYSTQYMLAHTLYVLSYSPSNTYWSLHIQMMGRDRSPVVFLPVAGRIIKYSWQCHRNGNAVIRFSITF